jgi:alkyl hydroperoxide reductase subunit AhpC
MSTPRARSTLACSGVAKIMPEFDRRGVKVIGRAVDPVDKHTWWAKDIEETQGIAPTPNARSWVFDVLADSDSKPP